MSIMASFYYNFLLFSSIFLFISPISAARLSLTQPKTLAIPVLKDKCTHQYLTQLELGTPLVLQKLTLHLGGKHLWVDCDNYVSSSFKPVLCSSTICRLANANGCSIDPDCDPKPNPWCFSQTCSEFPSNPIVHLTTIGEIRQDVVSLQSVAGKNVLVPDVPFVCGTGFLLENLADGVVGVAGLGISNLSLPAYFASSLGIPNKFSLCLSSLTNSSGVIYFGDAPYSSDLLTYTPLILNAVSASGSYIGEASNEYYIGVKSILVGGKEIKFNKTLLSIDNEGKGGTKISTVHPYTILHTSIYKAVLKAFTKRMKDVFPVNPPIPPFGACYRSAWILDFKNDVPQIDLVLEGEGNVNWRLWSANSMVNISSFETCLGFVDGGSEPDASIIIGGRQIEDNMLQFDLKESKLGFSSSLHLQNTSCSNFNAKSAI